MAIEIMCNALCGGDVSSVIVLLALELPIQDTRSLKTVFKAFILMMLGASEALVLNACTVLYLLGSWFFR